MSVNSTSGIPLPNELFFNVFTFIPPTELLQFKTVCSQYRWLIESDDSSQTRIAELYLQKKPCHAYIPLDKLKHFLHNTHFTLEIDGNVNVFHLNQDLTPVIPWISHLIVKNCGSSELGNLLKQLEKSHRLAALFLYKCDIKEGFYEIVKSQKVDVRICSCNLEGSLPGGVKQIPEKECDQFNIKNLESGDGLAKLEQEVQNTGVSSARVLQVFDSVKSTIQSELVTSLWHGLLMDPREEMKPIDYIMNQARMYIANNPHHPDLMNALRSISF